MKKAVFLDRDGVLNRLAFNQATGEYESPHSEEETEIYSFTASALKKLQDAGYMLLVVSNQPSFAKGKATMANIKKVHKKVDDHLKKNGINIAEYFYCYHHPEGIVEGYSYECECRKPKPFFVNEAQKKYNIDGSASYFIGDQDKDVFCGKAAGVKTILLTGEKISDDKRGQSDPDYRAKDLEEAIKIILKEK